MAFHYTNNMSMTRNMTTVVYGIPNCDTVRKARKWLDQVGQEYTFHDVRAEPVKPATIAAWLEQLGIEQVVNKRSTAWRQLAPKQQQLATIADAVQLLQQHPTLMKRPLLAVQQKFIAGFKQAEWQSLISEQ